MAQRFRPPRDVPDFGLTPAEQARFKAWLRTAFVEIAEDLAALSRTDSAVGIAQETIDVAEGSLRRVTPPAGGMAVRVPPPTAANAGQSVRLMVEAPVGTLTVVSRPGIGDDGKVFQPTINGQPRATFTASGLVTLTSNGVNDWKTSAEFAREAPASQAAQTGQSVLDAEYLLGASNARLPRARVADDSSEIDISKSSPGLISWFLKTASVGFSKLANLTGLSVLGRASNSAGVMAAITATAANQKLVSNSDGSSLEWARDLPVSFFDTLSAGTYQYSLPAGFRDRDTMTFQISGNVVLNALFLDGGVPPPDGFEVKLALIDQSGGSAPGWSFSIADAATGLAGQFRTPGQVQGTTPGPDYVMRSEEECCFLSYQNNNWRIISGTAGQAITGFVDVSAGNGSTRTSSSAEPFVTYSSSGNMSAERVLSSSTSNTVSTSVAGQIQVQRAALTGFAAASANSNATTSAEPLVTYSASANMSAERVTTSSTTITVSTATAGQIEWRLGAMTGAISTSANSLSTLFAGIRTNGTLQTARGFINFVDTTTVVWTAADDSTNNEWEMRARHVFGNVRDNGSLETARGFINVLSTSTITALVTQDSTNDELELTWAVNQAADYAWTGDHDWSGGDYTFEGSIFGVHVNDVDIEANADITITSNLGDIILRGDATYLASNGLGGFLKIEAGTASPGLSLNEGMFWAEDPGTPATRPKFTDDSNTDHTLAYVGTALQVSGTVNNAAITTEHTAIECTATTTLNGIAAGYTGQALDIYLAAGGANTLTVNHASGSAPGVAQQIQLRGSAAYGPLGRGGMRVRYDGATWREISRA